MSNLHVVDVPRPDGARLRVQFGGRVAGPDRPTLLLLQGQASSHTWWTGIRDRYEDRFRTVTMDYRGTGGTQDPGGDLSTELLAADAVAVLDELKIKRAHVYDTSMGGRVAQVLAARHPARMLTLALACTSPGGLHAVERGNDVRKALASPDPVARQRTMVELFYTPDWGDDPAKSHLFGDPTMSTADRSRHLKMSARHDAWDLLPFISCPTLVLHGALDRMTPASNAATIADRIPGARVHLHPLGRHGFFDEFAADLHAALNRLWN